MRSRTHVSGADLNWDDLQYFLALYRAGTLTGAANELGVNHATVSRRITSFEDDLGRPLFEKSPDGWQLTATGESILEAALAAEQSVLRVERVVRAMDDEVCGPVRVAASRLLTEMIVLPASVAMRKVHPSIVLDITEGVRFVSLHRQEADIAVRMLRKGFFPGSPDLKMSRVGDFCWMMCAHEDLVRRHDLTLPLQSLGDVPVIHYNQQAPYVPATEWLADRSDAPNIVLKTNSMYAVRQAVELGLGIGALPECYARDGIVPVSDELFEMDVWLAIHPDLRQNRRIRAVVDFLRKWLAEHPDVLR